MGKFSVESSGIPNKIRENWLTAQTDEQRKGSCCGSTSRDKFQFSYNEGPASNARFSSLWWSDLAVGSSPRQASGEQEEVRLNLCNISKGKGREGSWVSAPDQQELSQLEAAVLCLQHSPS